MQTTLENNSIILAFNFKVMERNQLSVGIFIDGGYYAKINEGLQRLFSKQLDIRALFDYMRERIAVKSGSKLEDIHIVEAHYFRGRYRASDAQDKNLLYDERLFEDSLIENDIIFHYKHLRELEKKGGITVIEKGIDVWFALETYELSMIRKFDFVILVTGDADHEMLAKKLNALKTKVILLNWRLDSQSSTSRLLKEEVGWHLDLGNECASDKSLFERICTGNK